MKKHAMQEFAARSARQEWAEEFPLLQMKFFGYQTCKASAGLPHSDGWAFKVDECANIVRSARIQSKYTHSARNTSIQIESPHFDFLVIVQDIKKGAGTNLRDKMRYWVIPHEHFMRVWKKNHINIKDIDPCYQSAETVNVWQPIIDFLEQDETDE